MSAGRGRRWEAALLEDDGRGASTNRPSRASMIVPVLLEEIVREENRGLM